MARRPYQGDWEEIGAVATAPAKRTEKQAERERQAAEAREQARLRERERIKAGLTDAAQTEKRVAELDAAIDKLADEHANVTAPLQAELADVGETNLVRRIELRAQIKAANELLEVDLAVLHKERHTLAMKRASMAQPSDLFPCSSVLARVAIEVARRRAERAGRLISVLREKLTEVRGNDFYIALYRAELSAAESELAAAQEASAAAMAAAIAE